MSHKTKIINSVKKTLEEENARILHDQQKEYGNLIKICDDFELDLKLAMRLSIDILINENELHVFQDRIREEWQLKNFLKSQELKSPLHGTIQSTFFEKDISYDYERTMPKKSIIDIEMLGKSADYSTILRSGMSSISMIFWYLSKVYKNYISNIWFGMGYYETTQLIPQFRNFNFLIHNTEDTLNIFDDIETSDIIMIEPILANQTLMELNIGELVKKIKHITDDKIRFLIIDSSFLGNTFELQSLVQELKNKNIIIILVRSAMKLDQLGLELCQTGIIQIYFLGETKGLQAITEAFFPNVSSKFGINLTFYDYCLLDNGISFSLNDDYAKNLLSNARDCFIKLCQSIGELHHHNLYFPKNINSPMIYMTLPTNTQEFYDDVIEIILKMGLEFGLNIMCRNSFGFRNIAVEWYKNISSDEYIFKISPGLLSGANQAVVISTIKYLSSLTTIEIHKLANEFRKRILN